MVERASPEPRVCQVRSRRRRWPEGQTLQAWAWEETMDMRWACQVHSRPRVAKLLRSPRHSNPIVELRLYRDHPSRCRRHRIPESPSELRKITHSICRRPSILSNLIEIQKIIEQYRRRSQGPKSRQAQRCEHEPRHQDGDGKNDQVDCCFWFCLSGRNIGASNCTDLH
jgi:hypothetical protein